MFKNHIPVLTKLFRNSEPCWIKMDQESLRKFITCISYLLGYNIDTLVAYLINKTAINKIESNDSDKLMPALNVVN